MVKGLVELGADFNRKVQKHTPVMLSCKDSKTLRICKYLVESGADTTGAIAIAQEAKVFQTMVYLASTGAKAK